MEKRKQQMIRKKKRLLRGFMRIELLMIVAMISFQVGRRTGVASVMEKLPRSQVSASSQLYGAEQGQGGKIWYLEENSQVESTTVGNFGKSSDEALLTGREAIPELILVNKDHKLPDDFEPELKTLPDGTNKANVLAYEALCSMLNAGRKEGLRFEICSSYRSTKRQKELFEEDVEALMKKGYSYQEAYDEVARETMPPGYSEHATGLAFDIVALDYQMLDSRQKNTNENKWLRSHCAEYGFILRYPQDKEDVTGISYESWHFRYVGVEAAEYIMENEITLEEYLEGNPGII